MSVAEEAHKADVTRALDTERDLQRQLGEMRQERDLALQEKFKAELGAERARCDAESWKAAVSFLCVMLWFGVFLALVLVGILVLQAGEWYAERKEQDEVAKMDREAEEKGGGFRLKLV